MTYLSEDPTVLAGALLLLAAAFGVALKVTQQGKYLVAALSAAGLAVVVVAVEWAWVTDAERIEDVVYDLRQAVLDSDVDRVLAHLTPNVQYLRGETALDGEATRGLIEQQLNRVTFDLLVIRNLRITAGHRSRRGTAEFSVLARTNLGTGTSIWSLGFQEREPGVWKVNRISPVRIPHAADMVPSGVPATRRLGRGGGFRPMAPRGERPNERAGAPQQD